MAPNVTLSTKQHRSSRKKNAIGFAKRQSRKSQAAATGADSDVYEYSSIKNKRAGVTLLLDKDESLGLDVDGGNGEGDVDFDRAALRARIMSTAEGGDAVINSDDDEEIDSDDAFEESDEDRFAGFSFSKKPSKLAKRKPRTATIARFADVDLNEAEAGDDKVSAKESDQEEDEEEADGDSDEFLDVLDVLDGRGEPDFGDEDQQESGSKDAASDDNDEEEEDAEEEDDDDDDDEEMADPFALSDTELQPDGEALDNLEAFVSQLETGKKRKAEDGPDESVQVATQKRRMLKERTEAGEEGEFGVHAASGSKLQLDDLLLPLASTSSSLEALKKATKPLTKGDALSAPLPTRTQDRLDREAAYEQTKEEVDKWKATMKRIKEAEHLSFPLQVPQKSNPSNSGLTSKFVPSNPLESAVDSLLKTAGMREEGDIAKTEALKMNHLSIEEVAERRAELRKMRELMFRAEAKAKRVAKIKSKTYRKIQRKSRDRIKGLIKEAEGEDEEDKEEEQMKREIERARERATLRHKNTGKWAKAMKERGELDVDQRRDIEEMLERSERLRAKIQGHDGSDVDDEDGAAEDVDGIKASAFEELRMVEQDNDALPQQADKGVFAMKFMQDAMAREAQKVSAAAAAFRDEMERMEDGSDRDPNDDDVPTVPRGLQIQRTSGRMVYRPGQATTWPIAPSDSSSTLKSSEPALQSPAVASQGTICSSPVAPSDVPSQRSPIIPRTAEQEENPWLVPTSTTKTQPRRQNEIIVGKDSTGAVKSKNALQKRLLKGDEERQKTREDALVEISMDAVLKKLPEEESDKQSLPKNGKSAKAKRKEKRQQNGHQVDAALDDSDENSEVEAQEQRIKSKSKAKGVKAFEQRDLVALAFAGDNVVQNFEKLKQQEIAADAPREEDHTLPGWGSWGGVGTKRNTNAKKFIKKIAGIDPKSRADYGKAHVIISEKKDKKAAKYLTKDLPFPYTSRAQFEKSMEVPIGTEWNTRVGFQRQTLPRVVKKMGTVIEPLEKVL